MPSNLAQHLSNASAWTLAGRLLFAGCGLLVNILLARIMAPADFGVYFLAVSVVSLLILTSQVGLQVSVVRFVSETMSVPGRGRAAGIALKCALAGFLCALGVALTYAAGGHKMVVRMLDAEGLGTHANLIAFWICVATPLGILAESFRGSQQFRVAILFSGLSSTLIVLFCVLSWYAVQDRLSLELLLALCVGASGSSLLMALFHVLMHREKISLRSGRPMRELLVVSLPLMVMSLATLVTTQADLWIAGAYLEKAEVAAYGVASRLVQMVLLPLLVVNAVIAPVVAQFHTQGRKQELERMLGAFALIGALPGVLVLVVLSLFAAPVLALLYGEIYGGAAGCLLLLCLGQLANACCGPAATVLMMTGCERAVMTISLLSAGITFLGGMALAKGVGMEGVAAAAALAAALHGAMCLLWVRRSLGIWTYPKLSQWRTSLLAAARWNSP